MRHMSHAVTLGRGANATRVALGCSLHCCTLEMIYKLYEATRGKAKVKECLPTSSECIPCTPIVYRSVGEKSAPG